MPPSEDDTLSFPQPSRSSRDHNDNPFIAFRHFADSQMSGFLQSLRPRHDSPCPSDSASHPHRNSSPHESYPSSTSSRSSKPEPVFSPTLLFNFLDSLFPELHRSPTNQATETFDSWILSNPYSPLSLEEEDRTAPSGLYWRNAFEDLIDLRSGREMRPVDREVIERDDKWVWDIFHRWSNVPLAQEKKYIEEVRREKVQEENNPGSWKDIWNQAYKFLDEEEYKDTMNVAERWVRELEKLGKEMERSAKAYTRDRESQEEEDMTELDVYERLLELNRTSSTTPPQPSSSPSTPQQLPSSTTQLTSQQHPAHQATVTSTLTTTERITLPDGSVTTKMMLKKRFADGREESSETVHTENGNGTTSGTGLWQNDEHWDKPSQNDAHRDKVGENRSVKGRLLAEAVNKPVEEKRKGGWFWS